MSAGVILFVAFAACLVIGVPVSISLGVASLCSVVFGGLSASSTVIAQRIFGGLQSTSIMAIAFFVLAGNLMTKGGISRRIVNFANCLVGNVRGGMSLALYLHVHSSQHYPVPHLQLLLLSEPCFTTTWSRWDILVTVQPDC